MAYVGHPDRTLFHVKKIGEYLQKSLKLRKYKNLVEALSVSKPLRKFSGITVLESRVTDDGIVTKFSIVGFMFFLLWHSLYFYCAYEAHIEDQTILRNMHNTKVQRYGDDCERIISTLYVLFAMWTIPFGMSSNTIVTKIIIKLDKELEKLGEKVDYNRDAKTASVISIGQMLLYLVRLFSIWLILKNLNVVIPLERMYQDVYFNTLILVVTAFYCYILSVLRSRFRYLKKVLQDISTRNAWEYKIFVRGKQTPNMQKVETLQDKYICEKIRACAKIYGLLYKGVVAVNDVYGLILVFSMFICVVYIILYVFYFLEATSAGLFHDLPIYIDFCIYVFWQAAYALCIVCLIVYFCECVMRESKDVSYIAHEIINNDGSPSVTGEAMQLSLQLLHQKPIFTAYGFYELNYTLFEQGARAISTYLVILIQFVADANLN